MIFAQTQIEASADNYLDERTMDDQDYSYNHTG